MPENVEKLVMYLGIRLMSVSKITNAYSKRDY